MPEGDQLLLLLQKWEAVISISPQSFDVGIDLTVLNYEQRVTTIGEVLGGKSVGTLRQRLGQIGQYIRWATSEAQRPPFPVTAELIKNYVRHLRNVDAPHSRYSGTLEAFKFAKHVVGLISTVILEPSTRLGSLASCVLPARKDRSESNPLS